MGTRHRAAHPLLYAAATMILPARLPSKRRSGRAVAWLLGALLAAPSPAGATSPPTTSPPTTSEITPPRPIERLHADYPEGATGEHDVLLEVTVDAGGRVEGARVVEGEALFAEAAVQASAGWRF